MKKIFVSILITNFNKGCYLKKTINSCLDQDFQHKEILVFDDCSTDNSLEILSKFKKKIKIIINKKKTSKSGPLNQINGIINLLKKSKGEIIFFLDGDDLFKKKKIKDIFKIFKKDKKLNFLQDMPFLRDQNKLMVLKKRNHFFSIWPRFYPTSTIVVRRKFLLEFLKFSQKGKFSNLEIDARLSMFAFLKKNFLIINKSFTIYNYDKLGITSNYKKYHTLWWVKRNEAFNYFIFLHKKLNIRFSHGIDFFLTRLINIFI
jgi:glycosyltransferase involved in cell wall biosynthesis